ncbi:MAG TPA: DUF962 domain-containing protein [Telluria sp.]|nr:DUF962 domain-containing protein [Telluria sp.]
MEAEIRQARFKTFRAFYPYYLSEHANPVCRRLHFIGSSLIILMVGISAATGNLALLWSLPLIGYGCAWIGHFFFEHNRPATLTYPLYSLLGDWVMFRDILTGRVRW